MKRSLAVASLALCFALSACGGQAPASTPSATSATTTSSTAQQGQQAEPVDLSGKWKQKNSMDEDAYQLATIKGDVISIDWVTNNGDTKSIYWVGTFKAPKAGAESFTWTSQRDQKATDSAIMASGDDSKKFTFINGEISYEAGITGTITTMRLSKQ